MRQSSVRNRKLHNFADLLKRAKTKQILAKSFPEKFQENYFCR